MLAQKAESNHRSDMRALKIESTQNGEEGGGGIVLLCFTQFRARNVYTTYHHPWVMITYPTVRTNWFTTDGIRGDGMEQRMLFSYSSSVCFSWREKHFLKSWVLLLFGHNSNVVQHS